MRPISVTEYKGRPINGLTFVPPLLYRPASVFPEYPPVTRPFFAQAAAQAVAAAEPRRFGVIASCVVAGAILAAIGAQVQNPLLDPSIDDLLPAVETLPSR